MAWPGSVMMPPVNATPDQATADDDALPTVAPIAGHVPLPRHRPNVTAMVQAGALPSTMAANNAVPAGVPLPRARPAAAPEAAAPDTSNDLMPSFNIEQSH
jgi:hypothetical protein